MAPHSPKSASLEEQIFVELWRTADLLSRRAAQRMAAEELTPGQYNVLRILRGAGEGLPCGEIAARMITRDPDMTRLLDRLEQRGLISRCRDAADRRVVLTTISQKGSDLLAKLDEPLTAIHRAQLSPLGAERLELLRELLAAARAQTG